MQYSKIFSIIILVESSTKFIGGDIILKLKSDILREIGALSRSINTLNDSEFKKYDIQKGQFIFITRICENPGINLTQLTSMLKVDKTTSTKATQKLIIEGFVEKKTDLNDKRSTNLYPTKKALEIYNPIMEQENKQIEVCFKDFDEQEKDLVCKLIKNMRENMESDWYILKNYKE